MNWKTVKEFCNRLSTRYAMALFLFGAILTIISAFFANHPKVENRLEAAGLSIVITTAVTILLNLAFESRLFDSFEIIRGCQGAGIFRIFSNRNEAMEEIDRQVTRTLSRIDILAVAGRDLLFPDLAVQKQIEHWLISVGRPKIRILLLDPRSRHAVERSLREHGMKISDRQRHSFKYPEKDLCKDIVLSLQQMESKLELASTRGIPDSDFEVRTYDAPPFFLCIRLDDRIFIEQYHLGVTKVEENNPLRKFLGRKVPVIEAALSSELGQVALSHFDYVWSQSEALKFKPGCLPILQRALDNTDWVERFEEEQARQYGELASSIQTAAAKDKSKSAVAASGTSVAVPRENLIAREEPKDQQHSVQNSVAGS